MKWWWTPWRKRAWLLDEVAYKAARTHLWESALTGSARFQEAQANCEAVRPEGWTPEIEARRWNTYRPRARRWTA